MTKIVDPNAPPPPPGETLREGFRDKALASVSAVATLIPGVGGPLAQLLTSYSEHGIREAVRAEIERLATSVTVQLAELRGQLQHLERVADMAEATEEVLVRFVIAHAKRDDAEQVVRDVAAAAESRQGRALVTNLFVEGARSVDDERLHIMAAAVAGALVPDLGTELKSRAERALRQLEASDVVQLAKASEEVKGRGYDIARVELPVVSAFALDAANCIRIEEDSEDYSRGNETFAKELSITPVGEAVLRLIAYGLHEKSE